MSGDDNDAEVRCHTLVTGDTRQVRRVVTGDSVFTVNAVVTGNRRQVRRVRAVTGDSVLTVDACLRVTGSVCAGCLWWT